MKSEISLEERFFGAATVGERGQVVIPAEARKKCNINPGDKVLVLGHPAGSGIIICKLDDIRGVFSSFLEDLSRIESKLRNDDEESAKI